MGTISFSRCVKPDASTLTGLAVRELRVGRPLILRRSSQSVVYLFLGEPAEGTYVTIPRELFRMGSGQCG